MKVQVPINRNFRVFEADWAPSRALAILERTNAEFILIRRREGTDNLYYVFRPNEISDAIKDADAGDLRQTLNLHEADAAPTTSAISPFTLSRIPQVVILDNVPIGIIKQAERRTRGVNPLLATRGGNGDLPIISPLPLEQLTRYLNAKLPARILIDTTVSLTVGLTAIAQNAAGGVPLVKAAGTKIDVLIQPSEGLLLIGHGEGELEVMEPQPDLPLQFKLEACAVGASSVRVYGFCGGTCIGTLTLDVLIIENELERNVIRHDESVRFDASPRSKPDLSMFIFEQGGALTFRLQSEDGKLHMKQYGPTQIRTNPETHFRNFFRDIENLPLETPQQRQTAQRKMQVKGANLFDMVFPEDLKLLMWELRDRITSVQITSDEPWIPWELCRLTGKSGEGIEEGKFFAEAFSVTRWLFGAGPPPARLT